MKIALGQINPTVGDIVGNAELIRRQIALAREAGARLVIFPELALVGYPPRDLLHKQGIVESNLAALEMLARETRGTAALVGYVDRNPARVGRPLFNGLALLDDGRIVAKKYKTLLPNYDVFDETRYFEPGPAAVVVDLDGMRLGLSVCEDIWNPADPEARHLYPADPIAAIAAQRPDVIINISASPFILGKYDTRVELLRNQASAHGLTVVYCNQVGGNDELIFDGASLAIAPDGTILARGHDFEEDLVVFDLPKRGEPVRVPPASQVHPVSSGVASLHGALVLGLRDYFRKCNFFKALLGLSGGIDSAVVLCLAAEALGAAQVTAVALPSRYSASQSESDARQLAENLGAAFQVMPIEGLHKAFEQALAGPFAGLKPDITEENLQARLRGVLLMALSNKFGSLLLATGNKSELATGYCTLYGDMCGGLAPIGDVPKTMVYQLARYMNRDREIIPRAIIERVPTAELKPNQTDQDTLPPYDLLDRMIQMYVEELQPVESLIAHGINADLARRVTNLIDRSEYKRRQAAPVLKVSGRAFGTGRRMPIAAKFHPF